jgi:hypothetical protein
LAASVWVGRARLARRDGATLDLCGAEAGVMVVTAGAGAATFGSRVVEGNGVNGVSVARGRWVSAGGAQFVVDGVEGVGPLTISAERALSFDGVRADGVRGRSRVRPGVGARSPH